MGLDIYHYKLTKNRPPNIGYSNEGIYLKKGFSKFKERDWKIIEPFVMEVEYFNCAKSIFFSTIPSEIDFLTKELKEVDIISARNKSELEKKIKFHEEKYNLNKYNKEINNSTPPWNRIRYFNKEIKIGFYTENVGYQRKGITNKFWEDFDFKETYHFYFMEEDFLKAYSAIGHCWDSDSEKDVQLRKMKFKTDFIDNYEYGKSFMQLSF